MEELAGFGGKRVEHDVLGERRDRKQRGCLRRAQGVAEQHGLHRRHDQRTASVVGMLRRIVVEQSVVDVGENVVGDRRIVVGRIARRRRVTFGAEGTGFGTGIVACGVWQFDRVIGLSAQSSSVAGPVEQGVTDHERKFFV